MKYRYYTCDVFSEVRFGGNPLAVLPDALGLSDAQMQQIAREFNYSETTFVFPPEAGHTRKIRIFTPTIEVPFAGHPNVGTAFALACAGEFGALDSETLVTFEERAGVVPVRIEAKNGRPLRCELEAPEALTVGRTAPVQAVAAALSLSVEDITTSVHPPQVASVGLPFLFAELASLTALERTRVDVAAFEALRAEGVPADVHVYVRTGDGAGPIDRRELRARVFVPLDGVLEDPATGSANCALAGLLSHLDERPDGEFRFRIAQGVEMGRPSLLDARAEKREGAVISTRVGGACVPVCEGVLEVG